MTSKIYRSAQGKLIDLGALMLENEQTRAVGNMNVNARGDLLDSNNRIIEARPKQVQKQYKRQATVMDSGPVTSSTRAAKQNQKTGVNKKPAEVVESQDEDLADPITEEAQEAVAETPETPTSQPIPRGGLAAAIARSREVKQEKLKTPRQVAQDQAGVRKI